MAAVEETWVEVDRPVEQALALVERAAEEWGAEHELEAGRAHVALPVRAGLRQGLVEAEVSTQATDGGTRLTLHEIRSHWRVQASAVVVLLVSAAGGIVSFLWPFFPDLVPIAPFGAILALSGWFLVVSRLRTSRPADFLRTIELLAQKDAPAAD